jgi:hypothetical protein
LSANTLLTREPVRTAVEGIFAIGRLRNPKAFTTAYFHQPADLAEEVASADFAEPVVYGVEGPAWGLLKATEEHTGDSIIDSPMFHAAHTAALLAEPYPDLLAASSHLLAVARRT